MKKNSQIIVAIIVIGIIFLYTFRSGNSFPKNQKALSLANTAPEALLLSQLIDSQNRFADCIDEISKISTVPFSTEQIEKGKICRSSISTEVLKTGKNTYQVFYMQNLPVGCASQNTVLKPLSITVDVSTGQASAEWQNGISFSDKSMQNIRESIQTKDCKAFAEYITTHGTIR